MRTLFFRTVVVAGASMQPTLRAGDRLLATRGRNLPEDLKGRIVLVRTSAYPDAEFVKRVVATPGMTVEIKDGGLYLNGVREEEVRISRRTTIVIIGNSVRMNILSSATITRISRARTRVFSTRASLGNRGRRILSLLSAFENGCGGREIKAKFTGMSPLFYRLWYNKHSRKEGSDTP